MNLMDSNSEKLKNCACQTVDDIIAAFLACDTGYSEREAELARRKYGSNDLTNQKQDTILHCIRRAFVNPFSVVLFFLGIISLFADVLLVEGDRSNATSVIIIFFMLFVSGIVRLTQELKAKKISDELTTMVQSSVSVLRDGKWAEIPSGEIVVGDQVRLEAGDRVPADMRVTEGSDLFVSQSVITGESMILEKNADPLTEEPKDFSDYTNILFGGTTVTGGCGKGIVLAVGAETVYGGLSTQTFRKDNGFDRGANTIAWVMIRFMAVLVPIVFLASGLTKGNWMQSFLFALSVAVGLTPELLPMVVNSCLAKGSYSMGKKQTIVKNINAMQSLGSMDVLCVDKTGTLTGDQVILEYYMDILGNESQKTLDYAFLASHYHTGVGNHLDTTIQSVQTMPGKSDYYKTLVQTHAKMDEHPFDYSRRFSSVMVQDGEDGLLIIKGSIDEVVNRCRYAEHAGNVVEMEDDPVSGVHAVVDEMLEDGMKVIAVAYKRFTDDKQLSSEENDFILLGYLTFFDAPKKSVASAISKLQKLSVNIKVLTGDQMLVAQSICKRLGISVTNMITGAELERLSDNELPMVVENGTVFAGLSPKQKETIVEILQTNGHTVGFLGDGMNDLPAILQAEVGISVENAAEAVKDSANIILLKKDLNILEEGILCTDKTGTLTQDKVVLEYHLNVNGDEDLRVLRHAYLNSYFQTGYKNLMDLAIIHKTEEEEAADPQLLDLSENYVKVDEIPFDFTRRRLTTVVQNKAGKTQMVTKGAVEEMLAVCSFVECDDEVQAITETLRRRILDTVDELNDKGFRVLAIAQKSNPSPVGAFGVKDECDMVLMGYLAFLDPPKESTAEAIKALKDHGVTTKILTGDNDKVTRTICKQVGLEVRNMLLGSDLEKMSDTELAKAAETTEVFAKLTPDQKARIVSVLGENGHTVGFMGDGINDAAAMKAADIGISVDTAVDVAKESADIILLEKDLMVLEEGIIEGRKIYANMIKYIKMTASSNFGN